ncbi:carbohydrate ABC transporter permease [Gryllotalpicola protaetiae]|uniref:Carbohydrate ABC transporter permease n=1 Tax=Gryllotalpicola protaetiae TaxID=2419771 RepID=A0A387BPU9_9MICO|nr:carbohydrate ABC transporter permease [Gryllotalpicola protaetiae]AYG04084.1 carbohydrate ABC transporter permease [Gryllotalpicola protaetiae]
MTTEANDLGHVARGTLQVGVTATTRRRGSHDPAERGKWWRLLVVLVITAVVVIPIVSVFVLSVTPSLNTSAATGLTLGNFTYVLQNSEVITWLENSLIIAAVTVVVCVVIASPAGYVLSRGRNRLVSSYALILFVVQSLPVVTAVIPLYILFSNLHLADTLGGVMIIYVGSTMSVAIWMMAAYFDSIPISLEEAAWIDGASVFGSFTRVVLRNSLPGVLSTAIFAFLLAWNEYLVALVFLRTDLNYTLTVGLNTFFQQNSTDWGSVMAVAVIMMLPPIIVFAVLNRYFSVGGIGGSLAGR